MAQPTLGRMDAPFRQDALSEHRSDEVCLHVYPTNREYGTFDTGWGEPDNRIKS
jgi:hypothetical protein